MWPSQKQVFVPRLFVGRDHPPNEAKGGPLAGGFLGQCAIREQPMKFRAVSPKGVQMCPQVFVVRPVSLRVEALASSRLQRGMFAEQRSMFCNQTQMLRMEPRNRHR